MKLYCHNKITLKFAQIYQKSSWNQLVESIKPPYFADAYRFYPFSFNFILLLSMNSICIIAIITFTSNDNIVAQSSFCHKTGKNPPEGGLELAGGLGFEPRLTESESVVLPLDDPPKKHLNDSAIRLTLGILGRFSRFVQTDFLTFYCARIAGDKACFAQSRAKAFIVCHQGARNAVADGAGLSGNTAAFNRDIKIKLVSHINGI